MDNLLVINKAISSKKIISFFYDDSLRIVEPFLTGKHRDTGRDTLRAWFLSGTSKSRNPIPWRMYTIDKMSNIQILDGSFSGIREDYDPNDDNMSNIYHYV